MVEPLYFGAPIDAVDSSASSTMEPGLANRHGCISGATGTGKTVSLQKLAEDFSRVGVPVFLADIKGDLSGLAKAAVPSEKLKERIIKKTAGAGVERLSGNLLGCIRGAGTSGSCNHQRYGTAAFIPTPSIERHARRRLKCRFCYCG